MHILLYDSTFEGFLSCVFYCYDSKVTPVKICPVSKYEELLFAEAITIHSNILHADRVAKGIKKKSGLAAFEAIYKTFLSEEREIEMVLLRYIMLVLKDPLQANNFSNSSVLKVQQTVKQIDREVHRMHAFVRFQLTADDIYFAVIEPDFNVIPLIGEHFEKRYAGQRWVIYDTKRNSGIHYDLESMQYFSFGDTEIKDSRLPESALNEHEMRYQHLWKDYFDAVNIAARKNLKLHFRHVPKRYWKNLSEKYLTK